MGCDDFYPSQAQVDEEIRLSRLRDRGYYRCSTIREKYYECRNCGSLVYDPDLHEPLCPASKEQP